MLRETHTTLIQSFFEKLLSFVFFAIQIIYGDSCDNGGLLLLTRLVESASNADAKEAIDLAHFTQKKNLIEHQRCNFPGHNAVLYMSGEDNSSSES